MLHNDTSVPPTHEKRRHKHIKALALRLCISKSGKFQIVAKEVKLMLTFLLSLLPQRYSRTSICDDKELCPTFLHVPHSPQNLRPGNTAANIPNLMKHIISTGLAVLALSYCPKTRSGSETHRHQLRNRPAPKSTSMAFRPISTPPRCSRIREERLSPSGSERRDTKTANCLS